MASKTGAITKQRQRSSVQGRASKKDTTLLSHEDVEDHLVARKRVQNRISQRCIREKQLAQSRHMASFLETFKSTRDADDANGGALISAHLALMEENQQMKEDLLRMRKKLLSISNSAASAADDPVFNRILNNKDRKNPRRSPTPDPSDTPSAPQTASNTGRERAENELPSNGGGHISTVETISSDDSPPTSWQCECHQDSSSNLAVTGLYSGSTHIEQRALLKGGNFIPMALNKAPDVISFDPGPGFDDPSMLDAYEMWPDFSATSASGDIARPFNLYGIDRAGKLNSTTVADYVERACVLYACKLVNINVDQPQLDQPDQLEALKQKYMNCVSDDIVADLAEVAIGVLGRTSGLDGYLYGVGASEVMELIMRWRIAPTTANRLAIPDPFRPTPLQYMNSNHKHHLSIDFINWPSLRDQLILQYQTPNLEQVISDIVLNTVIDIPQMQIAINILDLFHNKVQPKMASVPSPVSALYDITTSVISGPREAASKQISREVTIRMAEFKTDEPQRTVGELMSQTREPKVHKYLLSSQFGIDQLSRWRLSKDFCHKYPLLECSSLVASFPMISCANL